jgi:hypothetical protein
MPIFDSSFLIFLPRPPGHGVVSSAFCSLKSFSLSAFHPEIPLIQKALDV